MTYRILMVVLAAVAMVAAGCSTSGHGSAPNFDIDDLASSAGVTPAQAQEGLGCMLLLAQRRLDTGQYQQIAQLIPDGESLKSQATDSCAFKGDIASRNELDTALESLGLSPAQSSKLEAGVLEYLSRAGSPGVEAMFSGAMK
jgi:type IV pilus biogenesis protein CpaD/CtpE